MTFSLLIGHLLPSEGSGFLHGFSHPFHGLDHCLAMIAVGLWAAQLGGRAVLTIPATFVSVMIFGGILGIGGVSLPFVETGIVASVFFMGALILASARFPVAVGIAMVGLFALCHGHAHGAEMPETSSGLYYGFGFALATSLLHLTGIFLGLGFLKLGQIPPASKIPLLRISGAAVILGGMIILILG